MFPRIMKYSLLRATSACLVDQMRTQVLVTPYLVVYAVSRLSLSVTTLSLPLPETVIVDGRARFCGLRRH